MIAEKIRNEECLSEPDLDENEVKIVPRHWAPPTVELIKVAHIRKGGTINAYYHASS